MSGTASCRYSQCPNKRGLEPSLHKDRYNVMIITCSHNISTRQAKVVLHGKRWLCCVFLDRGDRKSSPIIVLYSFPLYMKFIVAKMPLTSSTTSELACMMAMSVVSTLIGVFTNICHHLRVMILGGFEKLLIPLAKTCNVDRNIEKIGKVTRSTCIIKLKSC